MFIKHPIPRAITASRQCHRLSSPLSVIHLRRTYAAATATKTSTLATPFTLSEIDGIRVAARDDGGPTTGLSVVLRAGSRYCPLPGIAHLLEKFAWKVIFNQSICELNVGYFKANCVSNYKGNRTVGRSLVINFISRNSQCLRSVSPGRYSILP
jgi:hypothetical protein